MASSLNGLTVGDPLPENLMESPARAEGMFYPRLVVVSSLVNLVLLVSIDFILDLSILVPVL